MKNGHVIVAALVLAGASAAFQVASDRRHAAELDELRARSAALHAPEEHEPRNRPHSILPSAPLAARAPAPQTEPDEPEPAEEGAAGEEAGSEPSRPAPEPAEIRAELDTVFASDRPDPSWAADAGRTVGARVAAVLPEASAMREVDCHAHLCRIETTHSDLESYRRFVQGAFLDPETRVWNAGFFSSPPVQDERGELVATMYLAREGEPLPLSMVE